MNDRDDVLVVLAAGTGTRLGDLTASAPKWLLDVGGTRIADRQLDALEKHFDLTSQLRVVTGHGAAELTALLRSRGIPERNVLRNEHFATRNNWYSVLLALRELPEGGTGRVFVLNSDLFAPASVYRDFVAGSRRSDAGACLAVDGVRPLTDEAMKVAVDGDRITDIGKVGVESPTGEYIGMLMLDPATARILRDLMEDWEARDRDPNGWYETVIRDGLLSRADCRPIEVGGQLWVEIDDPVDLETARSVSP